MISSKTNENTIHDFLGDSNLWIKVSLITWFELIDQNIRYYARRIINPAVGLD